MDEVSRGGSRSLPPSVGDAASELHKVQSVPRSHLLHVRHIPGQSVTYLQNPKAATKTIESSMWQAHNGRAPDNPHRAEGSPFLRPAQVLARFDQVRETSFFTVARNPYTRFLSGYLNKVERPAPWRKISAQFGFASGEVPSPAQFLDRLAEMPPQEVNHHFRPQHLNVLHGLAPLEFVGHMEQMERVARYLEEHDIPLREESRSFSATGASALVSKLEPEVLTRVAKVYEEDFSAFGYSEDWHDLEPIASVGRSGDAERLLRAFS